jgi:hypothetical protein
MPRYRQRQRQQRADVGAPTRVQTHDRSGTHAPDARRPARPGIADRLGMAAFRCRGATPISSLGGLQVSRTQQLLQDFLATAHV